MSRFDRGAKLAARGLARIAQQSADFAATFREELSKAGAGASAGGTPNNDPVEGGARVPAANPTPEMVLPQPVLGDQVKSLFWDPYTISDQVGFADRPSQISFATLASIVWRVPVVHSIIQTRVNQVSAFATPQASRFDPGFRIRLRDPRHRPTRAANNYGLELQRMFVQTGAVSDPRGRDSFEAFLRKLTRDSLTYDQACFEVVPGRNGRPSEWYAVDAASIRRATSKNLFHRPEDQEVAYVQIYDNAVITEYTVEELGFMVRNPRTDLRAQGYGTSELEMLVSTVTSILYAWNYNQQAFSQGMMQKGLLNITGSMTEENLRALRRQWYQQTSGVENAWRTPITNAEKIEWINLQASNKDMEYSAWMDFLIKVACAVYQMDPIEVNFKYGAGGSKSMFDSGNKSKLVESKDRGLRPLLRHIARVLDTMIVQRIDPDFTIEFVGLDSMSPKEAADLATQRVRTLFTLDEMRAENDLPPLPDGKGKIILDTNWIAHSREIDAALEQRKQVALQAAQAAAGASVVPLNDEQVQAGPPPTTPPGGLPTPAAAQATIPQFAGQAPGAIPGQGGTGKKTGGAGANPEAAQGPDKDQIAELEGLLRPSHSSSITSVKKSLDGGIEIELTFEEP